MSNNTTMFTSRTQITKAAIVFMYMLIYTSINRQQKGLLVRRAQPALSQLFIRTRSRRQRMESFVRSRHVVWVRDSVIEMAWTYRMDAFKCGDAMQAQHMRRSFVAYWILLSFSCCFSYSFMVWKTKENMLFKIFIWGFRSVGLTLLLIFSIVGICNSALVQIFYIISIVLLNF